MHSCGDEGEPLIHQRRLGVIQVARIAAWIAVQRKWGARLRSLTAPAPSGTATAVRGVGWPVSEGQMQVLRLVRLLSPATKTCRRGPLIAGTFAQDDNDLGWGSGCHVG
jgi:hypothetical protein